jgi:mRNA-degrading endonuclease RelE of RelBE toxin-antitoxin system
MANVVISPAAQRQFHSLPVAIRARIEKVFIRLTNWPSVSGVKALSGNLAGRYRIRTGDYRVQFTVIRRAEEDQIVVEKIGHRDRFYDD